MGMLDTIRLYMDCPYCGETVESCQTKDLSCTLDTYQTIPDFQIKYFRGKECELWNIQKKSTMQRARIPSDAKGKKSVDVIVDCNSVECQFDADRDCIKLQGSPSGFGRSFTGKLTIEKGCFLSEIKDIELDGHDEEYFKSYKQYPKVKKKLKRILPKCKNQEVIAVRHWGRFGD